MPIPGKHTYERVHRVSRQAMPCRAEMVPEASPSHTLAVAQGAVPFLSRLDRKSISRAGDGFRTAEKDVDEAIVCSGQDGAKWQLYDAGIHSTSGMVVSNSNKKQLWRSVHTEDTERRLEAHG